MKTLSPMTCRSHPSDLIRDLKAEELSGVRIVFVNMPLRETAMPNTPPQGPGLMAARLRHYGAEVSIIDLNAYRIRDDRARTKGLPNGRHLTENEAEELISRHFQVRGEPDLIGFSGLITTLRWQKQTAQICRRLLPDVFLISGGGLATEIKTGLFKWIPELDAIAHSEGDDVILIIARELKKWKNQRLGVRRNGKSDSAFSIGEMDGRERFVYGGDRPKDLDSLPFAAWDLLEEDVLGNPVLDWYLGTPVWGLAANNSSATPFAMTRSLTTVSSRGCPYACAFCYRGAQGERNYGMRSVENLAREVAWLKDRYNVDFVGFPDDNFAVRVDRCQQLPEAFAGLNMRWGTHTRLDEADLRRLVPMRESGCTYIGFGAESASENTLKRMNKGGHILVQGLVEEGGFEFPKTMVDAIKNCHDLGIHSNCTWIMGYPGESLDDLKTSVGFILWQRDLCTRGLRPGSQEYDVAVASVNTRMFTATAYPGTAMFRDPVVRGQLSEHFGIAFEENGEPVHDRALEQYVEELDDATKVLVDQNGQPLYFGAMSMDQFLEARDYVDSGQIEKILAM